MRGQNIYYIHSKTYLKVKASFSSGGILFLMTESSLRRCSSMRDSSSSKEDFRILKCTKNLSSWSRRSSYRVWCNPFSILGTTSGCTQKLRGRLFIFFFFNKKSRSKPSSTKSMSKLFQYLPRVPTRQRLATIARFVTARLSLDKLHARDSAARLSRATKSPRVKGP